jgi:hypothetical protein
MKNDSEPFKFVPKVGSEYIKLKNGKLVKWTSFHEESQTFEYKLEGKTITVHRREIEIPTANEEIENFRKLSKEGR